MALTLPASVKVTAEVQGSQTLNNLARQLQQLSTSSQLSGRSLDKLYTETRKLGAAAGNTISGLRGQAGALRALRDEAEFGSRKFRMLTRDIEQVEARLRSYQQTASQSGGLSRGQAMVAGVAGGIAGAATAMAAQQAANAVRGIADAGLNAETAQVRLKALTTQFGEYNQAQASTERISRTLRISQTEAADGFSKLYAALRPTGVTLKETEDAFIGFTAAARVSGATSAEASAALLQLKQALGSGVLQGDELRSIREQAPLVGQAIAKEMGVTIGELKKLGSEGKITTDIVLKALASLKDENLGKLNQQFDTGAQAIKDFQVAAEGLGKALARIFGPATVALIREVTRGLKDMTDVLGSLAGDKDAEERIKLKIKARDMAADEAGKRFGVSGLWRQGEQQSFFQQRQQQILDRLEEERLVRREQQAAKGAATKDQQRAKDEAAAEREAARQRAAKAASEDEVKIRQDAEEKLADAVQQRAQELADFRKETVKRAAELEQQLGDQRLQIEREVEANRRKSAQALMDASAEQQLRAVRAAGGSVDGLQTAREVTDLFRQFDEQRIQNQDQALDRQTALQRQIEQFKISVTEGIGKIQEAYARSVSSILQDAGDKLAKKMMDGANAAASVLAAAPLAPQLPAAGGGRAGGLGIASIADSSLNANARAWLAVIRAAEGTAGPNGYRTMFGGGLFSDMSRHPDRVVRSGGYASAAAGAYQFMPDTWRMIGGGAMTPERQDRGAMALAQRRGVNLSTAPFTRQNVAMLAPEWASLPTMAGNSYYGQPVKQFGNLANVFRQAGGPQGSARRMVSERSSDAVAAAQQRVQAAGAKLQGVVDAAKTSSNDAAFNSLLAGLEGKLTGVTAELDQQRQTAREKLEDERAYGVLLSEGITPELAQQRVELGRIALREADRLDSMKAEIDAYIQQGNLTDEQKAKLQEITAEITARRAGQAASIAKTEEEIAATKRLQKAREEAEGRDIGKGLKDGVKGYLESIGTLAEGVKGVTGKALKGLEDQLVNFVTTGKANFKELAASILADMARIAIQQMVLAPILRGVGSLLGAAFAGGGVMTDAGPMQLRKYASGGIADSPQLALFGEGSMPEAYVPLPDGRRIPVALQGGKAAAGGGNTLVTVNVDASGSKVQGDSGRSDQLGRAVAAAVQEELLRQKRPGGLLAA